ncbi:MAG: uroporphyrinogen decarboxylase [Deltaproteobacteria bacterium]|nr:uroporphyrinogen decarboxylase [Deltaproteobacteria bacterium]
MTTKSILQTARCEELDRTPIWMMRQAGRYLPEYHEVKERAGGFLGLCKIPEYGIEATLQPIRRFGFDAAILFSDILIPAEAMGIDLAFNPGPIIGNPVRNEKDVSALTVPDPEESLGFVMEILRGLRQELSDETTLIGFAGAPFTVASYIVEGGSSTRGFEITRRMMYEGPEVLEALLAKVAETTIRYLRAQVSAGAEIVQLFDSSAGYLPPDLYKQFALAFTRRVIDGLDDVNVPVIYFAPGAMTCIEAMGKLDVAVIGVDFRVGLDTVRDRLGSDKAVQGNLDPAALLGTPESVASNVRRILRENAGRPGHVFNLGHGVLPDTPISNVEAMVAAVRKGL